MTVPKHEARRFYPPEYVSAETLAYRLDCSRSTIEAYVRSGLLPKPELIGNLPRWDFAAVVTFIKARNEPAKPLLPGQETDDVYLKGIRRGTAS